MLKGNDAGGRDRVFGPSLLAVGVVGGLFGMGWWALYAFYGAPKTAEAFGNQFGAVNTLFSGLAFAGIVVAVFLQQRELQAQRSDLELTRDVLAAQQSQLEKQASSMVKQSFENTFFALLNLHAASVSHLKLPFPLKAIEGASCFPVWLSELDVAYQRSKKNAVGSDASLLREAYARWRSRHQQSLGKYFRSLKSVVRFLDEACAEGAEPYARAVRAQLTDHEMVLIIYECEAYSGSGAFGDLIVKHSIVRGFDRSLLLAEAHQDFRCCLASLD